MNTLSICTLCQDEEEPIKWYLECCAHLNNALAGSLREVVLVDGGSKDNTIDIIKSYMDRVPITLLERPFDYTRNQLQHGIEHCTGDFIFDPDADMTWTTNFSEVFLSGKFDASDIWDFPMLFTGKDAYHYFHKWPFGVNWRLWKRHRKLSTGRKFHISLEGQTGGLPVCGEVVIFENSGRIKNEAALLHRGERRQVCTADMALEGASPGSPTRFLEAARSAATETALLPEHIKRLVLPSTNNI